MVGYTYQCIGIILIHRKPHKYTTTGIGKGSNSLCIKDIKEDIINMLRCLLLDSKSGLVKFACSRLIGGSCLDCMCQPAYTN